MDMYRKHWQDIGGVLAMVITGSLALFGKRLSRPQLFSALNFVTLLVHQFEEYRFPGFFPGQFNGGVLKSDKPDRYPLNTNSATIINVAIAYPFYILPVLFPKKAWLCLSPVLFGFAQALGHGIVFPRLAKARYSPGFLASLFLHVPIGIAFIRSIRAEQPLKRSDWIKAILFLPVFAAGGVLAPQQLLKDEESPYQFTEQQVGSYGRDSSDGGDKNERSL
ncbi:MAG TPA: HXXEE domain-containing protein [Ktedonobacteraceae bacterium]